MRTATTAVLAFLLAATTGNAALAGDEYLYFGPHPVPASVLQRFDTDWIDIEGEHYFPYAPDSEELDFYIIEEGAFSFIGDPTMYAGYHGDEYWYYDPHPVDYYGYHHVCYIQGPHVHYFAPTVVWLDWYYWDSQVYIWYGPWPAHYVAHRRIVLADRYPGGWAHHHRHIHLHQHYADAPPPKGKPAHIVKDAGHNHSAAPRYSQGEGKKGGGKSPRGQGKKNGAKPADAGRESPALPPREAGAERPEPRQGEGKAPAKAPRGKKMAGQRKERPAGARPESGRVPGASKPRPKDGGGHAREARPASKGERRKGSDGRSGSGRSKSGSGRSPRGGRR